MRWENIGVLAKTGYGYAVSKYSITQDFEKFILWSLRTDEDDWYFVRMALNGSSWSDQVINGLQKTLKCNYYAIRML